MEDQALDPLFNPTEHGLSSGEAVLQVLKADETYAGEFASAFEAQQSERDVVTLSRVAAALAAFQRTLIDAESPFDRHLNGQRDAITDSARRGWELFRGSAQCIRCHSVEGQRPLFTDHGFHSLSVGLGRVERRLPELVQRLARLNQEGRSHDHVALADADIAALGRFVVTLQPVDIGKFKTPGLRNVALTAPYMHDGSVGTLAEAIDLEIYYRSTEDGRPLILTPAEKDDLLAFMQALTSSLFTKTLLLGTVAEHDGASRLVPPFTDAEQHPRD